MADVALGDLVPHDVRHTAASLAISAGASVKAVQRMPGHSSAQITLDRYAHLFEDDLDSLAESMGLEEDFEDVRCVAVPLRIRGSLIGAVGISGPATRLPISRLRELGRYVDRKVSSL